MILTPCPYDPITIYATATAELLLLSCPWKRYADAKQGKPYFHNEKTGETVWGKPAELRDIEAMMSGGAASILGNMFFTFFFIFINSPGFSCHTNCMVFNIQVVWCLIYKLYGVLYILNILT